MYISPFVSNMPVLFKFSHSSIMFSAKYDQNVKLFYVSLIPLWLYFCKNFAKIICWPHSTCSFVPSDVNTMSTLLWADLIITIWPHSTGSFVSTGLNTMSTLLWADLMITIWPHSTGSSVSSGLNTMSTLLWADLIAHLSCFKDASDAVATTVNKIISKNSVL